ncbi:PREDICTED: pinin-like isoform X2 [Ceratosolen solmsi marchali]|uniref:Pinin-like isoform X2 n=1 Tax=Ceratosolen solmsi marchali TaxID=326594 RepID=A0AAJ6YD89_9HYME|nr:PREDICTED: pinin-like isoform X2 [Ceratosolen solmsi marchali]
MSGSRLGRGRAGRLALLGCSALAVVFLMFLYRSTNSEMARLRDLHLKCTQQQEALATQLQVIYEYKLQLEKTLSNEKSANAAAKEELQKKASRERSLRDKDIIEAMQRFNSLQQNYKLLQTEHQDLKDDCKKKEAVALEDSKRLESTLQDLRIQLKKAGEDKEKSMEHLKIKYMELINQKEQLEENYNNLKKLNGDNNGNVEHLEKQVIQLQRELDDVKKSPHFSIGVVKSENTQILPRHEISLDNIENKKSPDIENNEGQVMRPSSFLQVNVSNSDADKIDGLLMMQSASESSSRPSSELKSLSVKAAGKVKLPMGVLPIPRLIDVKPELEPQLSLRKRPQESAGQAPPIKPEETEVDEFEPKEIPKVVESAQKPPARHAGRHDPDGWYKLKPGIQEIGDHHHVEKSGFENEGGNEDVEQYDDYNYKEPLNKNNDLHIEEGEDEREDEDDYMHNNMNAVKHE